jgi:alkanesulfonate monooxygenase SsuD/methylene tetrahydromethanopterin reductase-like flavin-dependent oxidoreductase (luciferase family)
MGAIAARTSKVKMCAAVSDTQRVHPAKLAHMVATLADISGGRTWLGIGAGEAMNVVPFGMPFGPPRERVQRLAEAIQVIRLLWGSNKERPVSFGGTHFRLENAWIDLQVEENPEVYVGALGGKLALEVSGRYGDGWVSWINTPETFKQRLEIAKVASRTPGKFEACVWVYTVITDDKKDIKKALNRAKRGLLAEANTLKMLGFSRPVELGKSFQNMLVTDQSTRVISRAQDSVPDDLASTFIAAGSPAQVIDRLEEFSRAGATRAMVHFVKEGDDQIEQFASEVLPHFSNA